MLLDLDGWLLRAARRTPAEQLTLEQRHERDDLLPRRRADVYEAIKQASGITDHDYAQADARYRAWRDGGGRVRNRPSEWSGGELDSMQPDSGGLTSLLEGFEVQTRGAWTWRDIAKVMPRLREVPGFENAQLPDDVLERHALQDEEVREAGRAPSEDDEHFLDEDPFAEVAQGEDDPWGAPADVPQVRQRVLSDDEQDRAATLRMLIDEARQMGLDAEGAADALAQFIDPKVPDDFVDVLLEEVDAHIAALGTAVDSLRKEQKYARRPGSSRERSTRWVPLPEQHFEDERAGRVYEMPENEVQNLVPSAGATLALPSGQVFLIGRNGALEHVGGPEEFAARTLPNLAQQLARARRKYMVRLIEPRRERTLSLFAARCSPRNTSAHSRQGEGMNHEVKAALLDAIAEVEEGPVSEALLATLDVLEGGGDREEAVALLNAAIRRRAAPLKRSRGAPQKRNAKKKRAPVYRKTKKRELRRPVPSHEQTLKEVNMDNAKRESLLEKRGSPRARAGARRGRVTRRMPKM